MVSSVLLVECCKLKFRWFHIIGSKRFARLVAFARKTGFEDEHRTSTRTINDLAQENAVLTLAMAKRRRR